MNRREALEIAVQHQDVAAMDLTFAHGVSASGCTITRVTDDERVYYRTQSEARSVHITDITSWSLDLEASGEEPKYVPNLASSSA